VLVSVSNNGADLGRGEVKFEYAVSGHVVSIVPSKGPTSGSTRVTIHGDGRKAVEVSGAMCVFGKMEAGAVEEGSKLICVSPRVSTAGTVQFMLRDKQSGTQMTATVSFEYYEAASIASLVPSTGYVGGGSIVTVIGSGLSADSLVCRFGEHHAEKQMVHWVSSTSAACVVPSYTEESGGVVEVEVSNNGGSDFTSSGAGFLYHAEARVESVRPSRAMAGSGGQVVTVVGRHFATVDLMCGFGKNKLVTARIISSTSLVCSAPAHSAATVALTVRAEGSEPGGQGSGVAFEFEAASVVSSVSPSKGLTSGGTSVTVHGNKLPTDARGRVMCAFGVEEVQATVVNSSVVTCTAPRVEAPGVVVFGLVLGNTAIGGTVPYEYYSAPVVVYIWPERGVLAGGGLMSVYGRGLTGDGLLCRFGGEVVSMGKLLSSTKAACTAPVRTSTGVVAVELSLNDGADFSDIRRDFTYVVGATVDGLIPSRGEDSVDGQVVSVAGRHFESSGQVHCRFGQDRSVQGRTLSSTLVACNVPVRGAGVVTVGVSDGGLHATGSALFEYGARRAVLSCNPTKGPTEGGSLVTVSGWGIESGLDGVECQFGMDRLLLGTEVAGTVVCSTPRSSAAGLVNFIVRRRSEEGGGGRGNFQV
jgi:hypothetical protein